MSSPEQIRRRIYEWCRPRSLADALQIIGAVVGTAWFALTTDFGQWRPILPLLAVAFFCFLLWAISLVRHLLYSAPASITTSASEEQGPTQPIRGAVVDTPAGRREAAVEFWLPSNWGAGFRLRSLGVEGQHEVLAEEIHLRIVAKQMMQNVRLELTARYRNGNDLKTVQIGSSKFVGVVPKGMDQTFLIMQRSFWNVPTAFEDPATGHKPIAPMRVEKGVTFFPENQQAFPGTLGRRYSFHVTVFHDGGPDEAHFAVELDARREVAQSRIAGLTNVQAVMGQ